MPNYNAHTYFGMRVLEELSPQARASCVEDLPVFRTALYGPDPLIFCSVRAKQLSDYLHKTWRTQCLPELERAIRLGSGTQRSFAAGYLLHHLLDDAAHPYIYRWMAEGSVHMHLEVALDRIILDEMGSDKPPHLATLDRKRTAQAAAGFIHPATEEQYNSGLVRMSLVTDLLRRREANVLTRVTRMEGEQARQLRKVLEETISPAAGQLSGLLESFSYASGI